MFADNLKTLRRARGLSQEELAGRLHVTRQTISKWENALSVPDAELLLRLAEELEVPVSRLLGGPVEEEPAPDQVAAHLAELNRLLAERNRRSRRIWRVVAGVLIGLAAATVLLILLNAAAFRSITTDTEQTAIPIEVQP
ncbi:helix-turn-helix transcriptional regulator [Flavonifractor sp. An10]|uniref:helix-turn-helix domain-containing protein n=2 Tax=Flavonifractor TaxID=946234 RepID=UPI000B3864B1|nr:helix-turn-helix transcriptional regulator [Flavonifractor sp. An10]OUQ81280.1 hypothetical protein B5E42_11445 [Flavonifractor sp. An10]